MLSLALVSYILQEIYSSSNSVLSNIDGESEADSASTVRVAQIAFKIELPPYSFLLGYFNWRYSLESSGHAVSFLARNFWMR